MPTILDTLLVRIGPDIDLSDLRKLDRAVQSAQQKLNSLGDSLLKFGAAPAAAATSVAAQGIKTDAALRTLEARTGATADQLERFKQQAYEVGGQLPLNTADIIEAQTAFVQLGNSIDQAVAATPGIAQSAVAAEGVSVGDAATYASIGLRAFGLEAAETTDLLDQMLKAETTTPATMRDIGNAFRFSAQAAADAGLNTQAYIATLGTLAGSGRSAEESSQGLNVILQKLAKGMTGIGRGGKMVNDILNEVGLKRQDVQQMLARGPTGLFDFLETLRTAIGDDQEMMTAVLGGLVGESYSSAFSYLTQNVEEARAVYRQLMNAQGESARQAAIKMRGISGGWESFKAQLDTVQNVLSDIAVSPFAEKLLRGAADLMAEFTRLNEQGEYVHGTLLKIVGAVLIMGPLMIGAGLAAKGLAFALGGFSGAVKAIGGAGAAVAGLGKGLGTGLLLGLRFVPVIGWIIGAASMVIAAWEPISTFFKGLWDSLTEGFETSVDTSGRSADQPGRIVAAWGRLRDALGPVGDAIESVVQKIGDAWESLTSLFDYDATEEGQTVGDAIVRDLEAAIDFITSLVNAWNDMVALISRPVAIAWDWLSGGQGEDGEDGASPFAWVTDGWNAMVATLKAKTGLWDWLERDPEAASPFAWVGDAWDKALAPLSDATAWKTTLDAVLATMKATVKTLNFKAIGTTIADALWKAVKSAFDLLLGGETGLFGDVDWAKEGKALVRTLADGIESVKDEIYQKVREALGPVGRLLSKSDAEEGPLSRLSDAGRAIVHTIGAGIASEQDLFYQRMRDALGFVGDGIQSAAANIANPLPVGPLPGGAAAAGAAGGAGRTYAVTLHFAEGAIQITADGGTPGEIASEIGDALEDRMRAGVEQVDTRVLL